MGGEAADEVVRLFLNGTEVAVKLTGSAAKNLAAILVAYAKGNMQMYGKTSMMKLLKSGDELQVFSLTKEQYGDFKKMAGKNLLYALFANKKAENGNYDVVISSKSVPVVNHILQGIGYGKVSEEKEETAKKDTRPLENSSDSRDRPQTRTGEDGRTRESTVVKLETFKAQLEKKAGKEHTKTKDKVR